MQALAKRLVEMLRECGATFAVAESVTGGLVGALVTSVPGASDVFRGAVVAYVDDAKVDLLGVERGLLETEGAVSAHVARQMARGVRERLGVSLAVSTTGFAGPTAAEGMPVGLVYIGLSTAAGGERAHERRFEGTREEVRGQATHAAIRLALDALDGVREPD